MRLKKPLVIGTAAVAVLASVTGAALASGKGSKAPAKPAAEVTTPDSDNIQEGDQTSPDTGIQAPAANAAAVSANAGTKASASTGVKTADENPGGGENSGEGENSGDSDGPGGWQDPPGDVNHEFQGQE